MKVKAKHWLNVNGVWHKNGEIFEVESIAGIGNAVEVIAGEPKPVEKPKATEKPEKTAETTPRRKRTSSK